MVGFKGVLFFVNSKLDGSSKKLIDVSKFPNMDERLILISLKA